MRPPAYWFPAKRYGWGWGLPSRWQGWVVLLSFFALMATAAAIYLPRQQIGAFLACTAVLTIVLLVICVLKGEPPAWRWGK